MEKQHRSSHLSSTKILKQNNYLGKKNPQSRFEGVDCLKVIGNSKAKALEIKHKTQLLKASSFWKLEGKLQQQLRLISNFHTPIAREKLTLLQKCRNQKHIRRLKRQSCNLTNKQKSPTLHRPLTCKSTTKPVHNRATKMNPNLLQDLCGLNAKIEQIKTECTEEQQRSEQLKDNIDTAFYYCELVTHNSKSIIKKIL